MPETAPPPSIPPADSAASLDMTKSGMPSLEIKSDRLPPKNEEAEQRIAQRHPSKQINTAEDVAALVAFLLSSSSKNITGQILGIDGGMSTLEP